MAILKKKIPTSDKVRGFGYKPNPALHRVSKAIKTKSVDVPPQKNYQELDAVFYTQQKGNMQISLNSDPNRKDDGKQP
jgi:hypothetical protein